MYLVKSLYRVVSIGKNSATPVGSGWESHESRSDLKSTPWWQFTGNWFTSYPIASLSKECMLQHEVPVFWSMQGSAGENIQTSRLTIRKKGKLGHYPIHKRVDKAHN
jgi:hypothetical protein